jgi:hypothetical protein
MNAEIATVAQFDAAPANGSFDFFAATEALIQSVHEIEDAPAAQPDVTAITLRFIERDLFADFGPAMLAATDWSASIDAYAVAIGAEVEAAFPGALVLVLHDNRPGFLTGDEMIDIEACDGDERAWAVMTVAHITTRVFQSVNCFGWPRWVVQEARG